MKRIIGGYVSKCLKDPPCESDVGPLLGCHICNPSASTDYERVSESPSFIDLYRGWLLLVFVAGAWIPVGAIVWIIWEIVR